MLIKKTPLEADLGMKYQKLIIQVFDAAPIPGKSVVWVRE